MAAPGYAGLTSTRTACDATSVKVDARRLEVAAMALTVIGLLVLGLIVGGESCTQLVAYQVIACMCRRAIVMFGRRQSYYAEMVARTKKQALGFFLQFFTRWTHAKCMPG